MLLLDLTLYYNYLFNLCNKVRTDRSELRVNDYLLNYLLFSVHRPTLLSLCLSVQPTLLTKNAMLNFFFIQR